MSVVYVVCVGRQCSAEALKARSDAVKRSITNISGVGNLSHFFKCRCLPHRLTSSPCPDPMIEASGCDGGKTNHAILSNLLAKCKRLSSYWPGQDITTYFCSSEIPSYVHAVLTLLSIGGGARSACQIIRSRHGIFIATYDRSHRKMAGSTCLEILRLADTPQSGSK